MLPPLFTDNSHYLPWQVQSKRYSCAITDTRPVTSYSYPVRCAAPRCIHNRFPMCLSSAGCFLFLSPVTTYSLPSLCFMSKLYRRNLYLSILVLIRIVSHALIDRRLPSFCCISFFQTFFYDSSFLLTLCLFYSIRILIPL